jgi:hypothetical protein
MSPQKLGARLHSISDSAFEGRKRFFSEKMLKNGSKQSELTS